MTSVMVECRRSDRENCRMARDCFCGCGRRIPKFPIGTRAMNTRGKQVSERLSLIEDKNPHMIGENGEVAAWSRLAEAWVFMVEHGPGGLHAVPA